MTRQSNLSGMNRDGRRDIPRARRLAALALTAKQGYPLSVSSLCELWGVSKKTAQRDLRDVSLIIPIDMVSNGKRERVYRYRNGHNPLADALFRILNSEHSCQGPPACYSGHHHPECPVAIANEALKGGWI